MRGELRQVHCRDNHTQASSRSGEWNAYTGSGSPLATPPELPGTCSGFQPATLSISANRSANTAAGARGPAPPVSSPHQPSRSALVGCGTNCSRSRSVSLAQVLQGRPPWAHPAPLPSGGRFRAVQRRRRGPAGRGRLRPPEALLWPQALLQAQERCRRRRRSFSPPGGPVAVASRAAESRGGETDGPDGPCPPRPMGPGCEE